MNRRHFIASLGMAAIVPTGLIATPRPAYAYRTMRKLDERYFEGRCGLEYEGTWAEIVIDPRMPPPISSHLRFQL